MEIYLLKLIFISIPTLLLVLYITLGVFDHLRPAGAVLGPGKTFFYTGALGAGAGVSIVFVIWFLLGKNYPTRVEIYVVAASFLNAYLYTATALNVNVRYLANRRQTRSSTATSPEPPSPI